MSECFVAAWLPQLEFTPAAREEVREFLKQTYTCEQLDEFLDQTVSGVSRSGFDDDAEFVAAAIEEILGLLDEVYAREFNPFVESFQVPGADFPIDVSGGVSDGSYATEIHETFEVLRGLDELVEWLYARAAREAAAQVGRSAVATRYIEVEVEEEPTVDGEVFVC